MSFRASLLDRVIAAVAELRAVVHSLFGRAGRIIEELPDILP